jgi:hypothetical protein
MKLAVQGMYITSHYLEEGVFRRRVHSGTVGSNRHLCRGNPPIERLRCVDGQF